MEAGFIELRSKLRLVPAVGQLCPWVQQWGWAGRAAMAICPHNTWNPNPELQCRVPVSQEISFEKNECGIYSDGSGFQSVPAIFLVIGSGGIT